MDQTGCPLTKDKEITSRRLTEDVLNLVKTQSVNRMNAIWLEVTGCSGNIISFMDSDTPNLYEILTGIINLKYSNMLMGAEGSYAFEKFMETLDTDFILLVDGAISTCENGMYNIIANYNGRKITALEAIYLAGERAKYVLSVGTCASYGGISAAMPNPAGCMSAPDLLDRPVIRLPGCSCHPDWVVGTLAHLIGFGEPELDEDGRPILFYGITVHDSCTRRGFFDNGIYAQNFGDDGCMFQLGFSGPVTRADCPRRKWNGYVNWPVGANSNCIGCTQRYFPDGMEPFVRY